MYKFSEYTTKVYIREKYYNGEVFPEGMKVRDNNDRIGVIIRRGPNYVICLDENKKTFRSWISDLHEVHELGTDETREYLQCLTPGQKIEKYSKLNTPKHTTMINKKKSTCKEMFNDSFSKFLIERSAAGMGGKECFGEVDNKQEIAENYNSSLMNTVVDNLSSDDIFEGLAQARKNVGASTCWDGYKAKGTKTKNGREVPNCVKEDEELEEALDPVGKEDHDVDNDGDSDKSDKYLKKRRAAVSAAINSKKMKEGFSDWRSELSEKASKYVEVSPKVEDQDEPSGTFDKNKKLKDKKNDVKEECDCEEETPKDKKVKRVKYADGVKEGVDMKKREDIVMGMKKNAKDFKTRYGDKAKEVMYATATKMSK